MSILKFPSFLFLLPSLHLVISLPTRDLGVPDLGVPTTWRKFGTDRPRDERVQIAQDAIDLMITRYDKQDNGVFEDLGFWQSANVYPPMIFKDVYTSSFSNREFVENGLKKGWKGNYDPYEWWAQAAFDADAAYDSPELLGYAISTWEFVSQFQVKPIEGPSASTYGREFTTVTECNSVSFVGGVYWRPVAYDRSINSITTGLYTALSAHLAERTGEERFLKAAILGAEFIRDFMISEDDIVLDSISGENCGRSPDGWQFTYNSGKFIEGLSVLASITGDAQWKQLMIKTLNAAVKHPKWQNEDGVINEGASNDANNDGVGFKAVLIRGLMEAFRRNPDNTDLRILVHSDVDVQFNGLLDLARNGSSYAASWPGPASEFTTWGQHAALEVLTAAIIAND